MNITPHVENVQRQLVAAAAAGGDEAREAAGRLASALDAAARLAILDVLAEAAGEITRDMAPGSVDLRLRGRDVEFIVVRPAVDIAATPVASASIAAGPADDSDDASTSRTTLRLPDALKVRAERAAEAEGISLNAWLVRAATAALEPARSPSRETHGSSYTGWVR